MCGRIALRRKSGKESYLKTWRIKPELNKVSMSIILCPHIKNEVISCILLVTRLQLRVGGRSGEYGLKDGKEEIFCTIGHWKIIHSSD